MKRWKHFLGVLATLITLSVMAGCDKGGENIPDPNPNPNPNPPAPNPPNPNPNPPAATGCKTCEYYPVCDGTYYTYLDSVYPAAPVTYTDTLRAQADTTIEGRVYKKTKIISTRYPSVEYMNCENGVYRVGGKYGFSQKPIIILKANEPVGTTWLENPSSGVTCGFTITGKGLTLQVNNRTYNDVIRVKIQIGGFSSTYAADYYFAKGVGIIKYEYGGWNFDNNWYHRNNLLDFLIP